MAADIGARRVTGWCPVHDKVYEAGDGLCPRCGTALVGTEPAQEPTPVVIDAGEPSTEPPEEAVAEGSRRRPSAPVVGIAAAIVLAFVAGLAFPDAPDQAADQEPRAISADLTVGATRAGAGVAVRLESFTQRGRRIVARFTVPSRSSLPLGDLRSAAIAFRTPEGEFFEQIGVRPALSGFILEGLVLPQAETPVLGIRIDTLNLAVAGSDEISLDLTGAWPATLADQPRARSADGRLEPVEGRRHTVTGLIGWADRLDLGVRTIDANSEWWYEEEWTLSSGATEVFSVSTGELVTFLGLPRSFDRVRLSVRVLRAGLSGGWAWDFL